jgi:hypothetical protein
MAASATTPQVTLVPVGCAARCVPPEPPAVDAAITTVCVSSLDILKLAKAMLDGCAQQKEVVRVTLGAAAAVEVRPLYVSRPHKAIVKQGGEAAFWAEAGKLARAFGVVPATEVELARWGYAAWRIPAYAVPPPGTVSEDGAEYSRV